MNLENDSHPKCEKVKTLIYIKILNKVNENVNMKFRRNYRIHNFIPLFNIPRSIENGIKYKLQSYDQFAP
jgi:hypothetical protein